MKEGLRKLIQENFCNLKTIIGCGYSKEEWCPKTCGYYIKNEEYKDISLQKIKEEIHTLYTD